jgi:uncharacterized protein (DUF1499 family)
MKRWLVVIGGVLAALLLVTAAFFAARLWHLADESEGLAEAAAVEAFPLADCATLLRPDTPNHWMVASGDCESIADAAAPIFNVSADRQARAWRTLLEQLERVRVMPPCEQPFRIVAIASTRTFGFSDVVFIRTIRLGAGQSTVAIYSRSLVGKSDLGTNRKRVAAWLKRIERQIAGN